ncbi:MAG: hypothetical protein EHM70_08505 [Chloroflexota bacterium]|nr:MAG: hypothetical protein EHM70_08505 [Chloroflexota bacterium]
MRATSTAIAVVTGALILLGYVITTGPLYDLRVILVQWAVILAAFALLVGVFNLLGVHWSKIKNRQPGSFYSLVLIISLFATAGLVGFFGPTHPVSQWIFNYIQVPIESSLLALLAVVLIFAGVRLTRRRLNSLSVIFIVSALLVMISSVPIFGAGEIPGLGPLRDFIVNILAVAGARGILLGVALGIIATGLRILMGSDRPYTG